MQTYIKLLLTHSIQSLQYRGNLASLLHKLSTWALLDAALLAYTEGIAASMRRGESSVMLPDCLFELGKPLSMALAKPLDLKYEK